MDLLPKKEVERLKADERRKEIDEGVKLAKKVDALRELAAKEEANLEKYRVESTKSLRVEISGLLEQKGTLVKEIKEVEERRRIALIPLDSEKAKVKADREELQLAEDNLSVLVTVNQKEKEKVEQIRREIEIDKARIDDELMRVKDTLSQAEKTRNKAEISLAYAKEIERQALTDAEYQTKLINARRAEVEVIARDAENQRQANLAHSIDLAQRERRLQDRNQMFIRNQKRNEQSN
jgi:hypothetical protein